MKRKYITLIFLFFYVNTIYSQNKLNESLITFKKVLISDADMKLAFQAVEFLDDDTIIYSSRYKGLFLLNINTNKITKLENKDFQEGFQIETWGDVMKIQKINEKEFYFLSVIASNIDYDGWNKYDLSKMEVTHYKESRGQYMGPKVKYQPDNFNIKKLDIKTRMNYLRPIFDPFGNYVFIYDDNFQGSFYNLYIHFLNGKYKKKLIDKVEYGRKILLFDNNYILMSVDNTNILLDYNGNIFQWYSNLVYVDGTISPDSKYVVLNSYINKDNELNIKYGGLILFEINQEVLKELHKYSDKLKNLTDEERFKRNSIIRDVNVVERYKFEDVNVIGDGIYKVRM